MSTLSLESLTGYWSAPEVAINVIVLFNLLGARTDRVRGRGGIPPFA